MVLRYGGPRCPRQLTTDFYGFGDTFSWTDDPVLGIVAIEPLDTYARQGCACLKVLHEVFQQIGPYYSQKDYLDDRCQRAMQYHPFLHALYESIGRVYQQLMSAVMEVDRVLLPGRESPYALIAHEIFAFIRFGQPPKQAPSQLVDALSAVQGNTYIEEFLKQVKIRLRETKDIHQFDDGSLYKITESYFLVRRNVHMLPETLPCKKL